MKPPSCIGSNHKESAICKAIKFFEALKLRQGSFNQVFFSFFVEMVTYLQLRIKGKTMIHAHKT